MASQQRTPITPPVRSGGGSSGSDEATMADGMVIVGAGECGGRAAFALREFGYDGPVTLIGEEPHHPYERPPLSKDVLCSEELLAPKWVGLPDRFAELNIETIRGRPVVAIDRKRKTVELADGQSILYAKLLLATGAVPRRLPLAPKASERIAYLRTYPDSLAI